MYPRNLSKGARKFICGAWVSGGFCTETECHWYHPGDRNAAKAEYENKRTYRVCSWALTGRCRFGDKCKNLHEVQAKSSGGGDAAEAPRLLVSAAAAAVGGGATEDGAAALRPAVAAAAVEPPPLPPPTDAQSGNEDVVVEQLGAGDAMFSMQVPARARETFRRILDVEEGLAGLGAAESERLRAHWRVALTGLCVEFKHILLAKA